MIPDFHPGQQNNNKTIQIELESIDLTVLLVDFLSEVLTESHMLKAILTGLAIEELAENKIKASLVANPIEEFEEDIKAVTYHEANVVQNEKGNWETMLIYDI